MFIILSLSKCNFVGFNKTNPSLYSIIDYKVLELSIIPKNA